MKLLTLLFVFFLPMRVNALEVEPPPVPEAGQDWMPQNTESLWDGILELLETALENLRPDLMEAARVSLGIVAAVLLVSILKTLSAAKAADTAGTVAIAALLLGSTDSMIRLAADTVRETASYGKLLLGVMSTSLAAQGSVTTSAALYGGTALFTAVLQSVMGSVLVPGLYLYLALALGSGATGEDLLKKTGDLLKGFLGWCLKTMLILFTTYLSLTRVISGTTDAAALKAARVSISSFVPVVGGILSDASEAVLVSAGLMKNAAGIYGILAVLALCLHPFLRIGLHYLLLKLTAAICAVFGTGRMTAMIESFVSAMGVLLGMTAAGCVMVLISTVCFMKGAL